MIDLTPFTFALGEHHNQKIIFIRFEPQPHLTAAIRKLSRITWSTTHRWLYVPDVSEYRKCMENSRT